MTHDVKAGEVRKGHKPPRKRWAAVVLALMAPVIAEVGLGSVPLRMAFLVLLYIPIYGAGVVLIREAVRRFGGGWPSVLCLGFAYGLVEEGLALQSLTSPHLYHAVDWAPRLFGVNTAYTELNLPYHMVFSVAIPIALVELLFPKHGKTPYMGRFGLVVTGFIAVLGVGLLRVSVPPAQDPGYAVPSAAVITILVLVVAAAVLALAVLPRRAPPRPLSTHAVPRPLLVGATSGVAAFGFLALLFPFGGSKQPFFTHGAMVFVPMAVAAAIAVLIGWSLRRWSRSTQWTPAHALAAIGWALVAHNVFGIIASTKTIADSVALGALALATAVLLTAYARGLRPRTPIEPATS